MTGGLGRGLADIRRDLEDAGKRAHHSPLFGDLERILEGAEPRGVEFAMLLPGEAWGLLLEMPAERRLRWLENVLTQGRQGYSCVDLDHEGRMHELARLRASILPTQARVEALCEFLHDAYERAAYVAGWEMQESSRKPWADVPEANKVTMRRAVLELLVELQRYPHPEEALAAEAPGDVWAEAQAAPCRVCDDSGIVSAMDGSTLGPCTECAPVAPDA